MQRTALNIFICLLTLSFGLPTLAATTNRIDTSDSSQVIVITAAMRDSICRVLSQVESYHPLFKLPTAWQLRVNLIKAVRILGEEPVQYNLLLDEVFWEIESLSERKKIALIGMVLAGGVSQKLLQITRRELAKRNLRQFVPSLEGAKLHFDMPMLPARMMILMDLNLGTTLRSTFLKGQFSTSWRQTKQYTQRRLTVRVKNGIYFMGSLTTDPWAEYRGSGVSVRTGSTRFYLLYQKNMTYDSKDYIYFQCKILFR